MTTPGPRSRRPARYSRWAASGLTAAVAVGAVGAMAEATEADAVDEPGTVLGAVARHQAEVAVAEMMAAADAGEDAPTPTRPSIGRAGVS